MSPFLAPVLAQVVNLSMADRTEARYLDYETQIYEASTSPSVALLFDWKRTQVALSYSPFITLTPLEEQPRTLLVYHQVTASVGYSWRHSSLALTSTVGFGTVNFKAAGLRSQPVPNQPGDQPAPVEPGDGTDAPAPEALPPGPTDPTPGDPLNGQTTFSSEDVRYYSNTTTLSGTHSFSKHLAGQAQVGQMRAGGLDAEAQELYPPLHSYYTALSASYAFALSAQDSFATNLALGAAVSSAGSIVIPLNAEQSWSHNFDPRTATGLSAGVNITRFMQDNGLRGFSVYPSFHAWLSHQLRLWAGTLAFGIYSYSGPTLDPLRATVDPRFGGGGNVTYTRDRFSIVLDGGAAISLNPPDHDDSSIDAVQAQAVVSYGLSDAVSVDAGARYWRQRVQEVVVIPRSWSAFVGLTLAYDKRLVGGH